MKRQFIITFLILLALFGSIIVVRFKHQPISDSESVQSSPAITPTATPTPTPRPLTFAEMNTLYGPCVYVPTLMYHHIQDLETAKAKNQSNLTVSPDNFRQHLEYLQNRGYTTVSMQELVNFFDSGAPLPAKPVLITFDDGYADFAQQALPLLNQFQAKTTLFLATGLTNNPDYLSWDQIASFPSNLILVSNHTWSHHNTNTSQEKVTQEITTADVQLEERGLNSPKVFSYPYGLVGSTSQGILQANGYLLAFTTMPGSTLCQKQRLTLPRIRIGNSSLDNYGL